MNTLTMGANAPVETSSIDVSVVWTGADRAGSIDVSAFLLTAAGKVRSDDDMIFYNQKRSRDGAIEMTGVEQRLLEGVGTSFKLDLGKVAAEIERIAFSATIGSGQPFSTISSLRISLRGSGGEIEFPAPLGHEAALVVGELYRRNGAWKFRAVGQGFNGGLGPLATSMGVDVSDTSNSGPPSASTFPPPPPGVPTEKRTFDGPDGPITIPVPIAQPPAKPVNLSKITLTKASPTVSLEKKSNGSFGEVRVNLNWNTGGKTGQGIMGGLFGGKPKGIDLDLACLFELANGSKGAVQALGNNFGHFDTSPFINLLGDDRTGANTDGEWLRINGQHWADIKRVLIYTFIYDGVPDWASTDGVITIHAPDQAPIEVKLDASGSQHNTCAIALFENVGGQFRVSREVQYFSDAELMDKNYRWGLRWQSGSKD